MSNKKKCEVNNGVRNLKGSVSNQYSNRINGSVQDFRQGHDQRHKNQFFKNINQGWNIIATIKPTV